MKEGDRRWLVLVTTPKGDHRLIHNVPGEKLQQADLRLGRGERAFVAPMDEVTEFNLPGIEVKPTLTKQHMRAVSLRPNYSPATYTFLWPLLVTASVLMGIGFVTVVVWAFG